MSSSPYAPAGKLLNQILTQKRGLKSLAYNSKGELTCSKTTFAQCSHVLEHKPLLDRVLRDADIDAKNKGLLYVLLYELLLGPNLSIRGGGALKRQLLAKHDTLKAKLIEFRPKFAPKTPKRSRVTIPRYVRVNTLEASLMDVVKGLPSNTTIYVDRHVPDLLVLPPTSDSRGLVQDFVTSHQVVLQDKSSCFSSLCLVHGYETELPRKCDYLDACAAPGNKTSHLASLVPAQARVHALDKSDDRFQLLKRRMKELTGTRVQCHHTDFLQTTQNDLDSATIRAILLDPSCSGSGMTGNHQEANQDPTYSNDRIVSVSDFQLQALQHATDANSFPSVERVVYSTCSLYLQENEGVVQRFLSSESSDEWELVAPKCLETWTRRGLAMEGLTEEQTQTLVRVSPQEDGTNGFFVACFQRKDLVEKRKKTTAKWTGPSLPDGVAFYDNEFHSSAGQEGKIKRIDDETAAKGKQSKRKTLDSPTEAENVPKKKAKKLEWKRKQKELKMARLLKKGGNKSSNDDA